MKRLLDERKNRIHPTHQVGDRKDYQNCRPFTSHKMINLGGDSPGEEDSPEEEDTREEEEYHPGDHQEVAGDHHHHPCRKPLKEN